MQPENAWRVTLDGGRAGSVDRRASRCSTSQPARTFWQRVRGRDLHGVPARPVLTGGARRGLAPLTTRGQRARRRPRWPPRRARCGETVAEQKPTTTGSVRQRNGNRPVIRVHIAEQVSARHHLVLREQLAVVARVDSREPADTRPGSPATPAPDAAPRRARTRAPSPHRRSLATIRAARRVSGRGSPRRYRVRSRAAETRRPSLR